MSLRNSEGGQKAGQEERKGLEDSTVLGPTWARHRNPGLNSLRPERGLRFETSSRLLAPLWPAARARERDPTHLM